MKTPEEKLIEELRLIGAGRTPERPISLVCRQAASVVAAAYAMARQQVAEDEQRGAGVLYDEDTPLVADPRRRR